MKSHICFFLSIILIFLLLNQYDTLIGYSDTILGKFIIILIIVTYTLCDKYLGLFISLIIFLFLQSRFIENMLNSQHQNLVVESFTTNNFEPIEKNFNLKLAKMNPEPLTNLNELYKNKTLLNETPKYNEEFKIGNCDGLKLKYKNMDVPNDMIKHIFPELKFHDETCNVCEKSCKFSLVEKKITTQTELLSKNASEM